MDTKIDRFKKILDIFAELPQGNKEMNLFDMTGYSHHENLVSNILGFYMQPANEHGLQGLLLRALLELCVNDFTIGGFGKVEITREQVTAGGKYIDLLIKTERYLIVLENKIYHSLQNDLKEYAQYAQNLNRDGLQIVKLVLSPFELRASSDVHKMEQAGFINITYSQYLKQIRQHYSLYALEANAKYLLFFNDFVLSLEHRIHQPMEQQQKWQFFENHVEQIEGLLQEYSRFKGEYLLKKMDKLKSIIDIEDGVEQNRFPIRHILVLDYDFKGVEIAVDVILDTKGYRIELFQRKGESIFGTEKWVNLTGIQLSPLDQRHLLEQLNLSTSLEIVKAKIEALSKRLLKASLDW